MPSLGGSEFLNRNDWRTRTPTADQRVLGLNMQRSKAAHDLLMRAQAQRAEDELALLRNADPASIYRVPQSPEEFRLQRIVQTDMDAKERGARMLPTEWQRLKYQSGLEDLRSQRLANYLNPLKFELDEARFGETQVRNERDWINQQQQRIHADKTLTAQEKWRQIQALNAEANRQQRERFNKSGYDQRERFHQDSMANFKSESDRKYYQDVAAAAAAGALTPQQVTQMFSRRFDPATMTMIRGFANRYAQDNPSALSPQDDPGFFTKIGRMIGLSSTPPAAPVDNFGYDTGGYDESYDDGGIDMGNGSDFAPPPPQMSGAPRGPQQGGNGWRVLRSRQTGQMVKVGPQGQEIPVPMISARDASFADTRTDYNRAPIPLPPTPAEAPLEYLGPAAPPLQASVVPGSRLQPNFDTNRFMQDFEPVFKPFTYLDPRALIELTGNAIGQVPLMKRYYGDPTW